MDQVSPSKDPSRSVGAPSLSPTDEYVLETLRRRAGVMATLETRASGGDPATDRMACLAWLAVDRQAARFRRQFSAVPDQRRHRRQFSGWSPKAERQTVEEAVKAHIDLLEERRAIAGEAIERFDPITRRDAERAVGIRVAVIGKGGTGKSVVSAMLARILARRGRRVLIADLDSDPGLGYSLGAPESPTGLPSEAIEPDPGSPYGWRLASGITPADVVERFSVLGPDDVRLIGFGKIAESTDRAPATSSMAALKETLIGFGDPEWDVIADLPAGPSAPFERYHAFAEQVIVMIGPPWRSALTARRLATLVEPEQTIAVVANGFRPGSPDHIGLTPVVKIPFDPLVAEAERIGVSPLDYAPGSPAIDAADELVDHFIAQEVPA